jgi:membrane fusion protein (multidrug efflux system)
MNMNRKTIRTIAFIGILILIGIYVAYRLGFLFGEQLSEPTPSAEEAPAAVAPEGEAIPVDVQVVTSGRLVDQVQVNGSTRPDETVVISSEISGKIEEILFKEGRTVKEGAILFRLNADELQAQRDKLVVQKRLSEKIAERLRGLYEKEGVSLQDYEVAEAEVDQFEAEIKQLDVQLGKTEIRAPFSGRVGLREVSKGSYVSPGTSLVTLVRLNPLRIQFAVPEKYSTSVKMGQKVDFYLTGDNEARQARVVAAAPTIDANTRTLTFEARASNPGSQIPAGAFAKVEVQLSAYDSALMVPTEAVIPELGGKKLFLYKGGIVEAREVTTGIRKADEVQILSGIASGDTVITTGVLQIRPGASVRINPISN